MKTGATLSDCNTYRYQLWRVWDESRPLLAFIMLNPSTASHNNDDPTIRRCMRFAATSGYGGIQVMNLFAYRATDPAELPSDERAIGPDNDSYLQALRATNRDVVLAWGTKGAHLKRNEQVAAMFPNAYCLDRTKDGHPKHPLYIRADAKLIRFQSDELALSVETA